MYTPIKFLHKDVTFGKREGDIQTVQCLFNRGFIFNKWVPRTYEVLMAGDRMRYAMFLEGRKVSFPIMQYIIDCWELHKARRGE